MCKFPLVGKWLFERGVQIKGFASKNKLRIFVLMSILLGVLAMISSQPAFYSQSVYKNSINLLESEVSIKEVGNPIFNTKDVSRCEFKEEATEVKGIFVARESEFEKELYEMVADHPIEDMVPYIAKKDRKVAGFLVGIAKKESNWGKRVPTLNGQDCFNYWGYKGKGTKGSSMGYSCFSTPEEAVEVVGGRLDNLVGKKLDTPSRMIVWKCGSSCAGHDPQGVQKWISDVSLYFDRISNKKV